MAKCKDEIELAKRIYWMVTHTNYTQRVIAERIGMTETALSTYMSGERTPKAHIVKRICLATGYPISFPFAYDSEVSE